MFKRFAMLVRGLMGCRPTAQSTPPEATRSKAVKPLPVQSGQASPQAVRKPASKKPKRKSSPAQAVTTAASRKPKQKPAQQTSGGTGLQAQTPASQPASKSAKRKPKAAQPTSAVKSRKPASKPAQTTSGKRGRPRKIPA